jgi:8-amino-7-oxononanoate synthase
LPPSITAGVAQAFDVMAARPELRHALSRNANTLYSGLQDAGFLLGPTPSPIVSVRLGRTETAIAFWNALLSRGLYVNLALPPATPAREALLRTSVSAAHTEAEIRFAVETIVAVGQELGVVGAGTAAAAE